LAAIPYYFCYKVSGELHVWRIFYFFILVEPLFATLKQKRGCFLLPRSKKDTCQHGTRRQENQIP
jgi:hypothetical protein